MRICSIENLPQKAILAKPIYDIKGLLLLNKGVDLTESLVNRLRLSNIFYIYIEDRISEGIEVNSVVDDQMKASIAFSIKEVMNTGNTSSKGIMSMKSIKSIKNIVNELIEEIKSKDEHSYMAVELMGTDMNTYSHSVNVAILSILTANEYGYPAETVRKIGFGALLHDIGKVKIDTEVLQKTTPFSDEEWKEMMNHSKYGYEMVKSDPNISAISKSIILNHHEKLDGSGYPNKLTADKLPPFLRIVTMADMFDALTTDRVYRKRISVNTALEILMSECTYKLDSEIYRLFIKNITVYPPGTIVILSEGTMAIITAYDKLNPSRPKLRVVNSENFSSDQELDLMTHRNIVISNTIM